MLYWGCIVFSIIMEDQQIVLTRVLGTETKCTELCTQITNQRHAQLIIYSQIFPKLKYIIINNFLKVISYYISSKLGPGTDKNLIFFLGGKKKDFWVWYLVYMYDNCTIMSDLIIYLINSSVRPQGPNNNNSIVYCS